ncbi:MAG: hypothetical protein M1823_006790, partial [Watsoniomyces obsoletus]
HRKDIHGEGSVDSLAKKHIEMVEFPTAEHYMMYSKALLMDDTETAEKILRCEHPSAAKKLGREVQNFDQKLWDQLCDSVVRQGNLRKFGDERNRDLREVLVGTGEKVIVEASPDDRIWGIGFDAETAAKMVEGEGREGESDWGKNKLGEALVWVREKLAARLADVEAQLAGREWLVGDGFTVADAYAFTILGWAPMLGMSLAGFPNLSAWMTRVRARPQVQAAL